MRAINFVGDTIITRQTYAKNQEIKGWKGFDKMKL